jgi:hypothetical protein
MRSALVRSQRSELVGGEERDNSVRLFQACPDDVPDDRGSSEVCRNPVEVERLEADSMKKMLDRYSGLNIPAVDDEDFLGIRVWRRRHKGDLKLAASSAGSRNMNCHVAR